MLMGLLGLLITAVWVVIVYWYLSATIGVGNVLSLLPSEVAQVFTGIFFPLAFLWLILGYFHIAQRMRRLEKQARLAALSVSANEPAPDSGPAPDRSPGKPDDEVSEGPRPELSQTRPLQAEQSAEEVPEHEAPEPEHREETPVLRAAAAEHEIPEEDTEPRLSVRPSTMAGANGAADELDELIDEDIAATSESRPAGFQRLLDEGERDLSDMAERLCALLADEEEMSEARQDFDRGQQDSYFDLLARCLDSSSPQDIGRRLSELHAGDLLHNFARRFQGLRAELRQLDAGGALEQWLDELAVSRAFARVQAVRRASGVFVRDQPG